MSSVTRTDSGLWKKLSGAGGRLNRNLKVGVHEGEEYPDNGPSVAQVAAWNHEGGGDTPPRPFLSLPLDGRTAEVKNMLARVSKGILDGKPEDLLLNATGQWAVNRVKAFINARKYAPNAESTKARKGSDLPLVDDAILLGSITFEVE